MAILTQAGITFGDGTTQSTAAVAQSAPTTTQVLAATAGASVGAVGTYAWLRASNANGANVGIGGTLAGSSLRYDGFTFNVSGTTPVQLGSNWAEGSTTAPAGTWRSMGRAKAVYDPSPYGIMYYPATLWLRIS